MRTQRFEGRAWTVTAESESGNVVWAWVMAQTPEQALSSFRGEFPGHNVRSCKEDSCDVAIIPA